MAIMCAACSEGHALSSPERSTPATTITSEPRTTVPEGDGTCNSADGGTAGAELLDCIGPSIVFIETWAGSGSGLVVADGYVVTNAHVVDPFDTVTVTFEDGEVHEDVPVVGTDLLADIAVLGPIETDHPALTLADPNENGKGDDLFLLGFPAETSSSAPELTIARGILSRFREVDDNDLTFVQTDAAIGAGQSGGALVDTAGRVVGISGLYYDEFAYALAGPDVQASIDRIRAGDVSEYRSLPIPGSTTTTNYRVDTPEVDEGWVVLPYAETDATIRVTLRGDAEPTFAVVDPFFGDLTFVSKNAYDLYGTDESQGLEGAREVEPGVFDVDIPADTYLLAIFGALAPAHVFLEASVPVYPVLDDDQGLLVVPGVLLDGVIDYFESNDSYLLNLVEGDEVVISVRSPTGDMAYSVQAPDQAYDDADYVDDSNVGLLGFDAEDHYVARTTGIHILRVVSNDGYSTGYRLEVNAA